MSLIPFDEALSMVLDSVQLTVEKENVPLEESCGRYLAEDIQAQIDVPGFDNSAMDGYAVARADIQPGVPMTVSQRIPAGADPEPLESGTVARIFTGAKVPRGADSVILQEDTSVDTAGCVVFGELPDQGQHIRLAGQDIASGTIVALEGKRLSAADVGLIASVGIADVYCARRLRVAFFSTGDELQTPGQPLRGAEIYNSNRYMLSASLVELGMIPLDLGCCEDSPEATRKMLLLASESADVVLTTGGMSVGEEDYVRSEVEVLGELAFWKIAMKPGKPFAMGQIGKAQFFGLPGNPVSTFVTFQLLVKPWLLKKSGSPAQPKKISAKARFDFINRSKRLDFVRVKVECASNGILELFRFQNQSSGVLSSVVQSNALMPVSPGSEVRSGDAVTVWLLN